MQQDFQPRITIEISPELKRAISLRGMMKNKTQKEMIKEALERDFKPELERLATMEKETKEVKTDELE